MAAREGSARTRARVHPAAQDANNSSLMTDAATTIKIDLAVFAGYAVQSACAPPAPARAHPQASRGLARLIGCVSLSFIRSFTF